MVKLDQVVERNGCVESKVWVARSSTKYFLGIRFGNLGITLSNFCGDEENKKLNILKIDVLKFKIIYLGNDLWRLEIKFRKISLNHTLTGLIINKETFTIHLRIFSFQVNFFSKIFKKLGLSR